MGRPTYMAAACGAVAGIFGSLAANVWIGRRPDSKPVPAVALVDEDAEVRMATRYREGLEAGLAVRLSAKEGSTVLPLEANASTNEPPAVLPMPTIGDDIAKHELEPANPPWADSTQRSLSDDLSKLSAMAKFTRFDVECRSKTCAGSVEWSSRADAIRRRTYLLHTDYKINTAVRIGMPEGEGDGPVRTSIFYEPAAPRT